jgi:hypothetical protein
MKDISCEGCSYERPRCSKGECFVPVKVKNTSVIQEAAGIFNPYGKVRQAFGLVNSVKAKKISRYQ